MAWQSHLNERWEWGDRFQAMAFGRHCPAAALRTSAAAEGFHFHFTFFIKIVVMQT